MVHYPARFVNSNFPAAGRSSPAPVLALQLLVGQRIYQSDRRTAVIQCAPNALDIAVFLQQIDSKHLSCAMRRHILRQPQRLRSALDIFPNGLSRVGLPAVPAGKNPLPPGLFL